MLHLGRELHLADRVTVATRMIPPLLGTSLLLTDVLEDEGYADYRHQKVSSHQREIYDAKDDLKGLQVGFTLISFWVVEPQGEAQVHCLEADVGSGEDCSVPCVLS